MKQRWTLIALWFCGLFVWNLLSWWSAIEDPAWPQRIAVALSEMMTPVQVLISLGVILVLWKRKPLADR